MICCCYYYGMWMPLENKMMATLSCPAVHPPPSVYPLSFPLFLTVQPAPLLRGREAETNHRQHRSALLLLFSLSFSPSSHLPLLSHQVLLLVHERGRSKLHSSLNLSLCPPTSVIGWRLIASQGFTHGSDTAPPLILLPLTLAMLLRSTFSSYFSAFSPSSHFFSPLCISLTQSSMIARMGFSLPKVLHWLHHDDSSAAAWIHSPLTFFSIVVQFIGKVLCAIKCMRNYAVVLLLLQGVLAVPPCNQRATAPSN